jgi:hypothetical protein
MVDSIDQHCDPGDLEEQDKLLALVIAHVTGSGQELNALHPLFLGKLNLANKGMEVRDEAGHHRLQPGIGRMRHGIQHIQSRPLEVNRS